MDKKSASLYRDIFSWAFRTGATIKERDEKLLRRLIFTIRGEETPGRFLDRLIEVLSEYRTRAEFQLDVNVSPSIIGKEWHGDAFHYLRATILAGFLNALSMKEGGGG